MDEFDLPENLKKYNNYEFILYRGVIENNNSPKKDGRVQVRIFGLHTDNLKDVKREHLAWAEVLQPLAFGFNTGIGFTSIPNKGTWVYVILDHNNPNMPIVIGAISGKPVNKADTSKGFNDPDGVFPLEDRLNEEDQNRLQRVQELDKTIHKAINDTLDKVNKSDSVSGADVSQEEPKSLSDNSKYPDNSVLETKSGHVIEIDDTPGNEKLRIYHKTGTYTDFRPDGSKIEKIKKNFNNIIEGYVEKHIKKYVKIYIEENLDEIITGAVKRYIDKTLDEHIKGAVKRKIDATLDDTVTGAVTETYGNQTTHGGSFVKIDAGNIYLN